jgi:hypothetical protein
MKLLPIDPAKGLATKECVIFLLKFTSNSCLNVNNFCDDAQEILYDDNCCTGHFRLAPASLSELTANYVEGAY